MSPLEVVQVAPWGVELDAPSGTAVGEVVDILGEMVTIDVTAGCGANIELYRREQSATVLAEQFAAATRAQDEDHQFPVKEKREDGFRVEHSWDLGLDTWWSATVGKSIGNSFYVCVSNGGPTDIDRDQAACVATICESLRSSPRRPAG